MIITNPSKPQAKDLKVFSDDRGEFVLYEDGQCGMEIATGKFGQIVLAKIKRAYYVVNNQAGVIRGYHQHRKEWKIFLTVHGSAKFVALNPDQIDPKIYTFTSSVRCPRRIIIPPPYANAWCSLEPNTILLCLSSSITEESMKDDVRYPVDKWGDLFSVKGR